MTLGYEYERPSGWGVAGDHEKRLRDLEALPCCCEDCPDAGGDTLLDLYLRPSLAGFWKFNEASGTTAADSSGNGRDQTTALGSTSPPTWGDVVGPPGDTSAKWASNTERLSYASYPSVASADFTVAGWFYLNANSVTDLHVLMCQGQNLFAGSGQIGWALGVGGTGNYGQKLLLSVGAGGTTELNISDNSLSLSTWYFGAFTYVKATNLATMYVNGLAQSDTSTQAISTGVQNLYSGNDNSATAIQFLRGNLSWWAIWEEAISGADLLAMYENGTTGGGVEFGKVWTAQGDGSAAWDYPTIAVYTDGV